MDDKKFYTLMHDSTFLSLFYNARKHSEEKHIPLEASFMADGLNKYKSWFFHLTDAWGLKNLNEINDFDVRVRKLSGTEPELKQFPLVQTKVRKLGSKGSGWHKEPISHSYATKFGKAPKHIRGR